MTTPPVVFNMSLLIFLLASVLRIDAADFFCASGDVTCLIASINEANSTTDSDRILLEPGTYLLSAVDNGADGPNGLPSITTPITIVGDEDALTTIRRDRFGPAHRVFHVAAQGDLTLDGIIVSGGGGVFGPAGGGIFNRGTVNILGSAVQENRSNGVGGIENFGTLLMRTSVLANNGFEAVGNGGLRNQGMAILDGCIVASNISDNGVGGISSTGTLIISNCTFQNNHAELAGGVAAISAGGSVTIRDSTIINNIGRLLTNSVMIIGGDSTIINTTVAFNQGAILTTGTRVINSTIVHNENRRSTGAISGGQLQNTIVAHNTTQTGLAPDCSGGVSLGNNIIGDPSGCNIDFQPTDLFGDPGLGDFVYDGPGRGYFPLLASSPAIDSAAPDACPETDQLGNARVATCDRGSVEFQNGRLLISIDVRPKREANRINPASTNNINVAIFSRNGFNANSIDVNSVRFGATGNEAAPIDVSRRDVDADGQSDVVLRFQIQDTGIACGDTSATLTGQIAGGGRVIGSSPIRTVQCNAN